MLTETLVLLGGVILPELVEYAARRGAHVIVVEKPQLVRPALLAAISGRGEILLIDYDDQARLVRYLTALHTIQPIRNVLSMTEYGLEPAAAARRALGLADHQAQAVEITRDKVRMRDFLAAHRFPQVRARRVTSSDALMEFLRAAGGPIIVKPAAGSGSSDVVLLSTEAEAVAFDFSRPLPFIAEEYVKGEEYSVESISLNGDHIILGVTKTVLNDSGHGNSFLEIAHQFPAPLDRDTHARICDFTRELLTALGIRSGPCHTELRVNESGVWLIETHTRSAGGYISDLVHMATGYDISDLAVAAALDQPLGLAVTPTARRGAAVRFFAPKPGIVRRISGVNSLRYHPGVVSLEMTLKPGDAARPLMTSRDRIGQVIAVADSSNEAMRICDYVASQITIEVD